jgi:hypothetical protein
LDYLDFLLHFASPFNFSHLRGVSPPDFCSCLIYQAQSPNKLGNYIFKRPYLLLLKAQKDLSKIVIITGEGINIEGFTYWGEINLKELLSSFEKNSKTYLQS